MPDTETTLSTSPEPGLRDNAELYGQAGLATYVAAAIFGNAGLPRETPEWLQASVESQANFAQRLPGTAEMTIGGASGGPLDMKTKQEREEEADAEAVESMRTVAERMDHKRQIEQQEWAQQVHSFAGVQMTGTEWHDLGTELKQEGELREWLICRLMRDGKSRKQAEGKADEIADIADIIAKPESERTDVERKKLERAEQDPETRKYLEAVEAKRHELTQPEDALTKSMQGVSSAKSLAARADLLGAENTPKASSHFQEATAANAPLDTPKPASPIALMEKQQTAQVSASGFDI